ncbi:hypothetical protein HK096_006947, partial [Nowakowskiella sp. JEL0078]
MGCDFVTTIPSHTVLDKFRIHGPAGLALFQEPATSDLVEASKSKETPKSKDDVETIFVTLNQSGSELVDITSSADIEDTMKLRMSMLKRYPKLRIHTQLHDAHVYIFKKWIIDYIASCKSPVGSLRAEFLPLLLRCQYDKRFAAKEGIEKFVTLSAQHDQLRDIKMSLAGVSPDSPKACPDLKVMAFVASEGLCLRVNTLWNYAEANRLMTKIFNENGGITSTAEINPSTQKSLDVLVGDGTRINERCTLKKSVIGNHCTIGKNVKIVNSVIMDYVIISDGVQLEGCIVCNNAKLNGKIQLKDCEVGAGYDFGGEK